MSQEMQEQVRFLHGRGVYKIPLTCGGFYIGQTERRIIHTKVGGHLPAHCLSSQRTPIFCDTTILGKYQDRTTREIFEAFQMKS